MQKKLKKAVSVLLSAVMLASCIAFSTVTAGAAVSTLSINAAGWFETAYAEWLPVTDAGFYKAYVKKSSSSNYEELDDELIRYYGSFVRADAVGLPEGTYDMKIEAYKSKGGSLISTDEKTGIIVEAYDRSGSCFSSQSPFYNKGVGAYNNDGSLKSNAKVLYVTADNAKTITTDVITSSKGSTTTCTGLQAIIDGYQKGYDTTPLAIRIIGVLDKSDMDTLLSSEEGLQIKGKNSYAEMPVTMEGIGNDAAIKNFGILVRKSGNIEFRNFAIMLCIDDALSFDTDNCNAWVHNMDFFYGGTGTDTDQAKGDGTVDIKANSQYITVSYNHFWDNGKSSLCGMKSETGPNYITYHHNWFDHSDSRHPRVRTMSVHIYNNFYDGNSKYGAASAYSASLFVEGNYFRNCKYPVLIGMTGHEGGSVLSEEEGVPIKMFNNIMTGSCTYTDYSQNNSSFDGYEVSGRNVQIPEAVTAPGGSYSNFDTNESENLGVDESNVDDPSAVPGKVMAYAGRCNGGDVFFTFPDDTEDTNYALITELKTALTNYSSTLKTVGGEASSDSLSGSSVSATGVDGSTKYADRVSANEADAAALPGSSTVSGGDDGSAETTTEQTSDASSETTTEASTVTYRTINTSTVYNKANFDGNTYFEPSDSANVYAHSTENAIRLTSNGNIKFTLAAGAEVRINACGANASDTGRTITLTGPSVSKTVTVNTASNYEETSYGTGLAAGEYKITSSNHVNINSVTVIFDTATTSVTGDADASGTVDQSDVKMILDYVVGNITAVTNADAADVSGDGKVTAFDAYKIKKYIKSGSFS